MFPSSLSANDWKHYNISINKQPIQQHSPMACLTELHHNKNHTEALKQLPIGPCVPHTCSLQGWVTYFIVWIKPWKNGSGEWHESRCLCFHLTSVPWCRLPLVVWFSLSRDEKLHSSFILRSISFCFFIAVRSCFCWMLTKNALIKTPYWALHKSGEGQEYETP